MYNCLVGCIFVAKCMPIYHIIERRCINKYVILRKNTVKGEESHQTDNALKQ